MKTLKLFIVFCITLMIIFQKSGISQGSVKPPYPIIFVHGWAGSDQSWYENGSWIPFLTNFGWTPGGVINVCLESSKSTLHDPVDQDVTLISAPISPFGDFFFLNFDVKVISSNSYLPYPEVAMFIKYMNASQNYFELQFGGSISISNNDIVAIGSGSDQEIVRVINADVQNNIYTINRYAFTSNPNIHIIGTQVKVHSNLSNQSSFVKSAKGIKLAIDQVKNQTGKNKVILVCHSMGGVNARRYVQSSYYGNDVALIATYSTPHLGSNKSDFESIDPQYEDYDLQSDAVRDLRYSTEVGFLNSDPPDPPYGDLPDNAVSLFGGTENLTWPSTFDFYSHDYNGDGIEGIPGQSGGTPVDGLNRKSNGSNIDWPSDVSLHCIIGQHYLNTIPPIPLGNDGVVRIDRQYPWPNVIPSELLETFTFPLIGDVFPVYIAHFYTHHQFPKVLVGLDEPDNRQSAYEIPSNFNGNYISGFTTIQPGGGASDVDYYKFTANSSGTTRIKFYNIQNVNSWQLSVYNNLTGSAIAMVNNNLQPGNYAELDFTATSGQIYYIGFYSEALPDTYQNPYKFQVLSQISISSVQFNQTSYPPGTPATLTVTLGNSLAGANVSFTCNSQTYTCIDVGNGIYNKTFIVPTTINNYPVIINASKTGYIDAVPFNTSLSVQNSGVSPYPPVIELLYPNNEVCHDECFIIWNDSDPDNNAIIYLYYDSNNSGLNGTCINPNNPIFEDDGGDAYVWNTVNMPEGIYWIYATIDDGTTLTSDYSPGYIEINHPDQSTDFDYHSKSAEEHDGDGDLIIESGESFKLDVWIKNQSFSTTYNYVQGTLTTTNGNVTITDNASYYGDFAPGVNKKGDNRFEIQVASGFIGTVAFQLNLEFQDVAGHMFYQVLDIPHVHIYGNVTPSFQVVDLQIIDNGDHCNNDGILQSGENSIDYKLKLKNNGNGPANNVHCTAQAFPPEFNTPENNASYPDISVGNSEWPDADEQYVLHSIPYNFTGTINNELLVTWGDNGSFSQLIPFSLQVFPAPRIHYSPETFDFGIKSLGDTTVIPIKIWNYGSADLVVSQIENLSSNPDNWITGVVFPLTISPADTVTCYLHITRTLQTNVNEIFRIHSNNHTVNTHDILISGTFFEPAPQGYVQKWSSDPALNLGGEWVETADLDNDGLMDVVTFWRANLYVWEQSAPNSMEFVLKFTYTFPGTEVHVEALKIGNCDGDNKIDIVLETYDQELFSSKLYVYETTGNDQYSPVWSTTLSVNCIEVGNCDADVYDEILIYDGTKIIVYNRTGNNAYSTTWNSGTTIEDNGAYTWNMGYMTTGDTDQDGKKEIIFPGDNEYMFIWEKNTSGSGYTLIHDPLVTFNPDPDGTDLYPKVYDIDNDNVNEIVMSGNEDGFQFSVFNPSTWTFEFHNSTGLYNEFSSPAIADLNGNGFSEVFLGGSYVDNRLIVYEYSGGSYFEIFASADLGEDIDNIESIDLDNDGVQELVLSMYDHFRVWKYEPPVLLPDLQIAANNISFSNPEPMDNDTILISALIRNVGTANAQNIPVEFYLSDPSLGNRLDSVSISSLATGGESMIRIPWFTNQVGTFNIYVVVNRENIIIESDFSNNIAQKSIHIVDNDTIPPVFLSHSHVEYLGDGDGLIEDNEYIRFNWNLFDESGISNTFIKFNNNQILNATNIGSGFYNTPLNNQESGIYPYEIHAIDNDNSPSFSVIYDTITVFQHAPHVISSYPINNAINVSVTDSILVEFDIPMNSSSINSNTFLVLKDGNIPVDPLSVIYHPNDHKAVFIPGILATDATYEVRILSGSNGVKDINNNILESTFVWTFNTISCSWTCGQSFSDPRDGGVYNSVQIGVQCWMKENLNVGTIINGIQNQSNNGMIEKYCYSDQESFCNIYGGLYQWNEMMQYMSTAGMQGICPEGWHVPTDNEWIILEGFADSQYPSGDPVWEQNGVRGFDAGKNLKSTSGWTTGNGTDLFDFSALPCGYRKESNGAFLSIGTYGGFWSSSQTWDRAVGSSYDQVWRYDELPNYGFSVRCLKNETHCTPENKLLQNIILPSGQTNCYNATQTITVAGNGTIFKIENGGSATMIAGQNILYEPGTLVQNGGYMWGYITPNGQYCGTQAPSVPAVIAGEENPSIIEKKTSFKVYPNPTTGNFVLELTGNIPTDKVKVDIYGIWGEKVSSAILTGERKHEFSLSERPTGVYFIRVVTVDRIETLKVIKQ